MTSKIFCFLSATKIMKISQRQLNLLDEQETCNWLYEIPGIRIAGNCREFYKSLVNARCVKVVSIYPPWYVSSFRRYFCEDCYVEIAVDERNRNSSQIINKHQLIPNQHHPTECSICGAGLFQVKSPYKCNDCILGWLLNRVSIENGQAITITWESSK